MTHPTNQLSGVQKFFGGANLLLQPVLYMGAFFYYTELSLGDPMLVLPGVIIGFVVLGTLAVYGNACMTRTMMYTEMMDEGVKASAHGKKADMNQPLPPLRVFLRRSFYAWIVFITLIMLIIAGGIGVVDGVISVLRPLIAGEKTLTTVVGIMLLLPVWVIGFGLMFGAVFVAGTIADHLIYRNEQIYAYVYKDKANPLSWGTISSGLWQIIKISLGIAALLMFILAVQIASKLMARAEVPHAIQIGLMLFIISAMLILNWRFVRRRNEVQAEQMAEKFIQRIEQDLIDEHGEDSDAVRGFRDGLAEAGAMTEEERQAQAKKLEETKEEIERFSIAGAFFKRIPVYLLVGTLIACSASVGMMVIAHLIGLRGEVGKYVGQFTFILFAIGGLVLLFRQLSKLDPGLPEEITQLDEAMKRHDYAEVVRLADILQDKLRLEELGNIIGVAYLTAGEIDRAEAVIRESIRLIMLQDKDNRNKEILSLMLTLLGLTLIYKRDYDKAEDALQQAIHYDHKNAWAFSNLTELNLLKGNPETALTYLERAIKANEQQPADTKIIGADYPMLRAWAHTLMGQYDGTSELVKEAFARAGDDKGIQAELHYCFGNMALAQGKRTIANVSFQRAIDALPGSIIAILAEQRLVE